MLALGGQPAPPLLSHTLRSASSPDCHTPMLTISPRPSAASSTPTREHRRSGTPHQRQHGWCPCTCGARRRVRYVGDDADEDQEHGHNQELATIEAYSAGARGEALLVRATIDGEEETVLVFKGFSSLLSSGTSANLATSVLPARAAVASIDIVRGPFDPSNVEFLERGLTWEDFKSRMQPPKR